ncbi:MAG: hypothetical protein K1060chlam2_01324 [Chlamydiae bacterium]|nr:hypothetical protein [Chlamydiota bacterium]
MADNKPEDISPTTNIGPMKSIQPGEEQMPKPGQSFESFMKEGGPKGPSEEAGGPSPFDLAGGGKVAAAGPTNESIMSQMNSTSSVLGDLQNQLNNKNLNLRQSQKYLLRSKLTHANAQIRAAANKAGIDTGPPPAQLSRQSPINKFLALLTDGQSQLSAAKEKIQNLNMSGQAMNPGDLLLIQVKLAKAQQELEYSSVLLSTAVSDIKTLFNIQL